MNDDPPPTQEALGNDALQANLRDVEAQELEILPLRFRFLTDHNVPDSVGNFLQHVGQDVVRLREAMAVNTSDPVVAKAAIEDHRILLSWDRDFNQQRFMAPRFAGLSRLSMSGPEMDGAARLEAVFDIVAFAFQRAGGLPLTVRVGVGKIQLHF